MKILKILGACLAVLFGVSVCASVVSKRHKAQDQETVAGTLQFRGSAASSKEPEEDESPPEPPKVEDRTEMITKALEAMSTNADLRDSIVSAFALCRVIKAPRMPVCASIMLARAHGADAQAPKVQKHLAKLPDQNYLELQRDGDERIGEKVCSVGQVINVERLNTGLYLGGLLRPDLRVVEFVTKLNLVDDQRVRMCGVFLGESSYTTKNKEEKRTIMIGLTAAWNLGE